MLKHIVDNEKLKFSKFSRQNLKYIYDIFLSENLLYLERTLSIKFYYCAIDFFDIVL